MCVQTKLVQTAMQEKRFDEAIKLRGGSDAKSMFYCTLTHCTFLKYEGNTWELFKLKCTLGIVVLRKMIPS